MKITMSQLWDEVRAVAAENPGYVYGDDPINEDGGECAYQRNDAPSCLVGHAMYRLGIPIEKLAEFDDIGSIGLVVQRNPYLFDATDRDKLVAIRLAQIKQDDDSDWEDAVARGERELA